MSRIAGFFIFKSHIKCLDGTLSDTESAPDALGTFSLFGRVHTHFADSLTLSAGNTLALIAVKSHSRNLIESTVDCSERAKVLAEGAVYYHRENNEYDKYCNFPGVKKTNCPPQTLVENHKRNTAFESAYRADIFAEPRVADTDSVADTHRKYNHKKSENDIFQLSQYSVALEGFYLFDKGYLVDKILKQTEGAKPTADKASAYCTDKHQKAHNIKCHMIIFIV